MFGIINSDASNVLVQGIQQRNIQRVAEKYITGRVIDIGCGVKPYEKIFEPYVDEHVGLEYEGTMHDKSKVDLFGTAYEIPVEDASFDSVLCISVLEHLEEPMDGLMECRRILKKDGIAFYVVPFIWHLHEEPRDFFRFTKYGLKYMFEKAGFEILELKALSGFWVTFGQLFVYNLYRLNRGPLKYIPVIPAIGLIIQGLSYLLDKVDKTEKWTCMYSVVARKKGD